MRVVAGKARGHKLFSPEGLHTRPTADRIKESLFNILMNYIVDSSFLDLYSGSGAIGIEALSRGAKSAVFVDNDAHSIDVINKNLQKTKLIENSDVMKTNVSSAIRRLSEKGYKFDIVFMDPPYYTEEAQNSIAEICENNVLKDDGIIVVEIAHDQHLHIEKSLGLEVFKNKEYNIAKIFFLRKEQPPQ